MIEHFDVLKDTPCGLVPCAGLTMIDELAVQGTEDTLDTGIAPTVPRLDILPVMPCVVNKTKGADLFVSPSRDNS